MTRREARPVKTVRRTVAAVAAVAFALTLTACGSSPSAGTAAQVGSVTISDSELARAVDELHAQLEVSAGDQWNQQKATAFMLSSLVGRQVIDDTAVSEGISISQGDVDALVADSIKNSAEGNREKFVANLAASGIPESQIPAAAKQELQRRALLAKLAPGETDAVKQDAALAAAVAKTAERIGVEIAPRFGAWDPKGNGLADPPNDLSSPVPTATPSPSAS